MHNIHEKFHDNPPVDSNVISQGQTHGYYKTINLIK